MTVTSGVEKLPLEGSWRVPVFRKALLAFIIVSQKNSPLSVGLAARSLCGPWDFRSAQMIYNYWSSVLNSESEKPTLCRKLEVSKGKYQLLFCCPGNGITAANFSSTLDIPAAG